MELEWSNVVTDAAETAVSALLSNTGAGVASTVITLAEATYTGQDVLLPERSPLTNTASTWTTLKEVRRELGVTHFGSMVMFDSLGDTITMTLTELLVPLALSQFDESSLTLTKSYLVTFAANALSCVVAAPMYAQARRSAVHNPRTRTSTGVDYNEWLSTSVIENEGLSGLLRGWEGMAISRWMNGVVTVGADVLLQEVFEEPSSLMTGGVWLATTLVSAPLSAVATRLACYSAPKRRAKLEATTVVSLTPAPRVAYVSFTDAVARMYTEEGVGAFYRGLSMEITFGGLLLGLGLAIEQWNSRRGS